MGRLAWKVSCYLWVLIPVLGWLPGIPQKMSLPWWMGICSIAAISAGISQPIVRKVRWTGAFLFACLCIFWIHQRQFGASSKWLMGVMVPLVAAHLIAERGEWAWLKRAIIFAATLQFPIIAIQKLGLTLPYLTLGPYPWGSVGNRVDLSILLGFASILLTGTAAWVFAIASFLTGSWTGYVIPLLRLAEPFIRKRPVILLGLFPAALLSYKQIIFHLSPRLKVWESILSWKINAMTGHGFLSFPGGFTYDDSLSKLIGMRDTHSVWFDWLIRTGVLGAIILAATLIYALRRSIKLNLMPSFFFVLWVGTWQSLEGRPLLALLGLVFMVRLQEDKCLT